MDEIGDEDLRAWQLKQMREATDRELERQFTNGGTPTKNCNAKVPHSRHTWLEASDIVIESVGLTHDSRYGLRGTVTSTLYKCNGLKDTRPRFLRVGCLCLCHESGPPDLHMTRGEKCPCKNKGT